MATTSETTDAEIAAHEALRMAGWVFLQKLDVVGVRGIEETKRERRIFVEGYETGCSASVITSPALQDLLSRMKSVHPDDIPTSLRKLRAVWVKAGCPGFASS